MLYLCEIPSSSWNDFMNKRQDEIVDMPSWEERLHEQGFSWMTAIWQQILAATFPSMASWPWKAQMKFLINFCHYQRRVRQSAKYHFVEFFAGNYSEYEEDHKKRTGDKDVTPTRVRYKKLA